MTHGDDIDALYRRYAPTAYRRACHLLGNDADAAEVVHDVFTSLIERPEQFAGKSALTTFMYSAVTHACLNHLRNRRTRMRLLQQNAPASEPAAGTSPEIDASLRALLAAMPEELATVTVYHHGEGLTHEDISRILGCSPRHVGNLIERAREFIRTQEKAG